MLSVKIKWSPQKQPAEPGKGGTFIVYLIIRRIRDMAAFRADVGVVFVQDFLSGRSKTVKDLSDLQELTIP